MPGLILHSQAVVLCGHGGQIQIAPSQTRALVNGMPIATLASTMVVGGCPGVNGVICTTAQWTNTSSRVLVGRQPVLVQAPPPAGPVPGGGVVAGPPPNTPLVTTMQVRVSAT